jgi:hypothetical protein
MSLRPLQQLSKSLSTVNDPKELGLLVGTIANCLDAVMQQCVRVYRGLQDASSKVLFLKSFRNGLLASNMARSYVDKIMTTVNQCCLEGLTFYFLDPSLNKQAQKHKAKEATEERAGCDGSEEADNEGDDDTRDEAKALKVKRPRDVKKPRPGNTRIVKKQVVVVQDIHQLDEDEEDSSPSANGLSASFRSPDSLLALKSARAVTVTLPFIDRLFEMFNSGSLLWNNGHNICVDLLLHVGRSHDKVLQANQRQPCGSVVDVFKEAIPKWNDYESQKNWIFDRSQQKKKFEAAMKSEQKWAITAPEVKGAVGLVLYAVLAYFPGLCFTNISHHNKNSSDEIRNNRGMAMLPSQHSIAMFSLLEQSGYVPPFPHRIFATSLYLAPAPLYFFNILCMYITKDGYPQNFWETSAVCLSSNDSALDVCRVQNSVREHHFRVWSENDEDCFHFEDPPPIWGLHATTSWVKISSAMWGEIGPRRYLLLPMLPPLQKQ